MSLQPDPPPAATGPLLRLRNLGFRRGGRTLLADADLQLAAGEIAALAGPSGSGKSTLAELIAYGHAPGVDGLRGDIVLDRDHCVHLMQFGALLDHLSVGANLRLVARYTGSGRSTRESLELLGLPASLATRPVASLSGGEYRRVAIARALLKEPRVLLLDEPDAGLDLPALRDLAGLLRAQAQEQQRAILILTHNPNLAAWAADRLLLLTAGRLQEVPVEHSERGFLAVEQRLEEALAGEEAAPRITRRSATAGFLDGLARTLACLVRPSPSGKDYLAVLGRTLRLSFLSALPFFVLVGFMFGATTIAALEVMRSQTLSGFLATIVTPRLVVETIRGSYVAYLAPAVGALLFAARSGSVLSGWLSSLAAGGRLKALQGVGVDPDLYLRAPVTVGLVVAGALCLLTTGASIWAGSVVMATAGLGVPDAAALMTVDPAWLQRSQAWLKLGLYPLLVALLVTGIGMAPRPGEPDAVARATTRTILIATIAVAVLELFFVTLPWLGYH